MAAIVTAVSLHYFYVQFLWKKNLWDCVIAHATTNLLLGIYVVTTDNWRLM